MLRTSHAIGFMFVLMVGLWGCSRGPSAATLAERIKTLEAKCSRLESDFRAAAATRDQLRVQLTQSEDQIVKLQQVVKERDELKTQLTLKISERDQVASQFDAFRQSLRELVGQAEAAAMRFSDSESPVVTISARPASKVNE
jgi:septal ring factor EnvC (AmiA/AmiB activator)